MNVTNRKAIFGIGTAAGLFAAMFALCACPPGTKVAGGISVLVNDQNCSEADGGTVDPNLVSLSCIAGGVEGTVSVTFPRKQWMSLKYSGTATDGAVGK